MDSRPSDLVLDSRIQVEFSTTFTYRFTVQSTVSSPRHVRRRLRKETWQVVKLLGSGSYGTVSLQKCLTSEGKVELQAVKMIGKAVVSDGIDYFKELEAIAKFSQKKYEGLFVEFIGWYENDDSVFVVMEYLEHGDLDSHLNAPMPESEAREITLQIAEGLKLLHENGFAHRDLKPANVFVFHKGPDWWVKIGDFGFSKRITEKDGLQTWVGTPVFLAPEVQMLYPFGMNGDDTFSHYTEKVDIWALGVITFYMIFHDYPFTPKKPIGLLQYIQGAELPFPKSTRSGISQGCISFIKATMAPDASNRLSAKEVTESEWLTHTDSPLKEMASLQITESKVSDGASAEKLPTQGPRLEVANNGNGISRTSANMPASDIMAWNEESSTREGFTSSKSKLSLTRSFQIESLSPSDGVQLQLKELQSLHTQGVQFSRENNWNRAQSMLWQAALGRKKLLGLKHSDTRNSYHCLGIVYYHMSNYSKAKQLFQWLLEAQEKLYGSRHQSTLKSRYWIGLLLRRDGNPDEGMDILHSVVKLQQDVLGPNHPETLLTLSEIVQMPNQPLELQKSPSPQISTSSQLSEMEKATEFMQNCIGELKSILSEFSPQHPKLRHTVVVRLPRSLPCLLPTPKLDNSHSSKLKIHYRTMAELGQRLHGQGGYYVAQSHLKLAANGLREALGRAHTETLETLYWLGRNHYEMCHYRTAEDLFCEVTEGFTNSLGKSNRKTLNALHATGIALSKQGKYIEAESVFRSALNTFNQSYYRFDRDLLRSLFQLGFVLAKQKKFELAQPILSKVHNTLNHSLGPGNEETMECDYWHRCASTRDKGPAKPNISVRLPPQGSKTAGADQRTS